MKHRRVTKRVAYTASQASITVWDPADNKRFNIESIDVSASGAGTIQFFDGTDSGNTVVTPILSLAANGLFQKKWHPGYESAAKNNVLKAATGSGAAGSILVEGWESD